jgi:predicted RNase H-like nuclease
MKLQVTNGAELLAAMRGVDAFFRDNDDFTGGGEFPVPEFIVAAREAMNNATKEEEMTAASLLALLGDLKWESEDIDDIVHNCKSREGSNINNGGLDTQVEYLIQQFGSAAKVWAHIGPDGTLDMEAKGEVEQSLFEAGVIEDPDLDGGLLG